MLNILKSFTKPTANNYVLPRAEDLHVHEEPTKQYEEPTEDHHTKSPIDYAKLQAEAILESARREAEEIKERAYQDAEQEIEELRQNAREEGYSHGFAEGMAGAMVESKKQREQQAVELSQEIQKFLETASASRDQLLEQAVEELKDLAIEIAEKVIRVSLKSSSRIIVRMIQAATEKRRRREWVHIYIAGCDFKGMANVVPELTTSLGHLSEHVRIIPMADDESGTCIIEFPDEIIDASVSTQLSSIRDVLTGSTGAE